MSDGQTLALIYSKKELPLIMLKKFQKFPLLQTSESVLSFMNGSTLVHLVV